MNNGVKITKSPETVLNLPERLYSFQQFNLKFLFHQISLTQFVNHLEHLFNLKFAVKDLERNSKKCEKEEKLEKAKAKKAIQKGNVDVARIHAENAIRQKSQSVNYLRMSARVDAVASRVQSALTTRNVSLVRYLNTQQKLISAIIVNLGHTVHGWRCQSNGCGNERNEFGKNFIFDGQI